MTAEEYIKTIQRLVAARRFIEARAFDEQHGRDILPQLTAEELVYVAGIMEVVDRVAEAIEADATAP